MEKPYKFAATRQELQTLFLSSLLPLTPHAQQRAGCAGQSHDPIVEVDPPQRRGGDSNVAQIAQQLDFNGIQLLSKLLLLDHLLRIRRRRNNLRPSLQPIQRINALHNTKRNTAKPRLIGVTQERSTMRALPNPRSVEDISAIQQHVGSVAELAPHGGGLDDRVERGAVRGDGGGLEVLDELAHAHQLARCAELLLGCVEGRDGREGPVCAVEVPC